MYFVYLFSITKSQNELKGFPLPCDCRDDDVFILGGRQLLADERQTGWLQLPVELQEKTGPRFSADQTGGFGENNGGMGQWVSTVFQYEIWAQFHKAAQHTNLLKHEIVASLKTGLPTKFPRDFQDKPTTAEYQQQAICNKWTFGW